MQKQLTWVMLGALSLAGSAWAAEERVEVPVLNALIPSQGYDDNDNVEAVLTGELPNPCYSVADAVVERSESGLRAHQYAIRRTDGLCGTGDLIDDPVPFTSEVVVGRLAQGDYRLVYSALVNGEPSRSKSKRFSVEAAPVSKIDTFDYASISNATVRDDIVAGRRVQVTLNVVMSSKCTRLKEPVDVKRVGDTFVVLPIIESAEARNCVNERNSFQKLIDLGTPEPGQYLLHIRSRNGKAVNRVFNILAVRPTN